MKKKDVEATSTTTSETLAEIKQCLKKVKELEDLIGTHRSRLNHLVLSANITHISHIPSDLPTSAAEASEGNQLILLITSLRFEALLSSNHPIKSIVDMLLTLPQPSEVVTPTTLHHLGRGCCTLDLAHTLLRMCLPLGGHRLPSESVATIVADSISNLRLTSKWRFRAPARAISIDLTGTAHGRRQSYHDQELAPLHLALAAASSSDNEERV